MTNSPEYFYRFRSIQNLIGEHQELANQEIFFSSPEKLNDPMEGFKDIYWKGDSIVWRNFFRHYLFCLERLCLLLILVGEQEPLHMEMIPISSNEDQLPTEEAKKISTEIKHNFFNRVVINNLIERLARRTNHIRRNELYFYLSNIHLLAIETIFRVFEAKGLKQKSQTAPYANKLDTSLSGIIKSIDLLEQLESEHPVTNAAERLYEAMRHTTTQLNIIGLANLNNFSEFKNRNFVIRDFPELYLNRVEELIYPTWYTACFMSSCSNASVWGHYGNNHAGVCLRFKPSILNGHSSLTLHGVNGWGMNGPISGQRIHQFYEVNYASSFPEIDFFRSVGRLPIPELLKFWYTNERGERSECGDEILSPSNDQWRESYWLKFHQGVTVKSTDWDYEKEFRLILSGAFIDFSDPKDRKLKYNFNDLDGIIFGIKTSTEHKLEIMEIIGEKCQKENRKEFNFYQASFSHDKGCITYSPLSLIKFQGNFQ